MSLLVRGDSVKTFLFQNVNLIENDKDQITKDSESFDRMENKMSLTDEVNEKDAMDEALDEEGLKVQPFVDEPINYDPTEKGVYDVLEIPKSAESLTLRQIMREEEFHKIDRATTSAESSRRSELDNGTGQDLINDIESQASDDQDETIINNYDHNNDSAYETNEMNSQNGSNSRLQSAETMNGDVDNETGENFKTSDIDAIEVSEVKANSTNNDETNVSSDDDEHVVLSAVKSKEIGSSMIDHDDLTGNEVTNDKEVQFNFQLFFHLTTLLYIHPRMHHNLSINQRIFELQSSLANFFL